MSRKFREWQPDAGWLFPPSPRDWLPEDHLVYFLLDVTAQIDLSPKGRPPKHLTAKEKMARRNRTKKGRAEYARRKVIIEPPVLNAKQGPDQSRRSWVSQFSPARP